MIIFVPQHGPVELREPTDFLRLKICVAAGAAPSQNLVERLEGIASIEEDGAAWVSPAAVKALAKVEDRGGWDTAFDAMVASVKRFGWVRQADSAVRAHIEEQPDAPR